MPRGSGGDLERSPPAGVASRRLDVGAPEYTAARELLTPAKDLCTRTLRGCATEVDGRRKHPPPDNQNRQTAPEAVEGDSCEVTDSSLELQKGAAPTDSGGVATESPPKCLGARRNFEIRKRSS